LNPQLRIGVSGFAWTASFSQRHLDLLPPLRDQGLCAFEVPMFEPALLPAAAIRRAMSASDLACTVCAILPQGINPINPDSDIRKKSIQHLHTCLETAAEMGATLVGGPLYAPIGYLPGHRRTADEWAWALDAFHALLPDLAAFNIDLSIEPVNRSETFFLNTAQDAAALCNAINHPRVGVTIDTFHANIEEKNIPAAIAHLGRHLKHMHLSENDRGLLGSGHIDFPAILAALKSIDFAQLLIIEGFGYSAQEPTSPGALWADPAVTPEAIAIDGLQYLLRAATPAI
jgi:D-psicose/D-tagatose/L-ribulose 3-epimerase